MEELKHIEVSTHHQEHHPIQQNPVFQCSEPLLDVILEQIKGYEKQKEFIQMHPEYLNSVVLDKSLDDCIQNSNDPFAFDINTQDCLCHVRSVWLKLNQKKIFEKGSAQNMTFRYLILLSLDQKQSDTEEFTQLGLKRPKLPNLNNLKNLIQIIANTNDGLSQSDYKSLSKVTFCIINNLFNLVVIMDLVNYIKQSQFGYTEKFIKELFLNPIYWFVNQSGLTIWNMPFFETYLIIYEVLLKSKIPIKLLVYNLQHQTDRSFKDEFFLENLSEESENNGIMVFQIYQNNSTVISKEQYSRIDFLDDMLEIAWTHQQHQKPNVKSLIDIDDVYPKTANYNHRRQRILHQYPTETLGMINLYEISVKFEEIIPEIIPLNIFHTYYVIDLSSFNKIFNSIPLPQQNQLVVGELQESKLVQQ